MLSVVGLATDQLYSLPRALADARRPVDPPAAGTGIEGVIPYAKELPLEPLFVLSYNHTVCSAHEATC